MVSVPARREPGDVCDAPGTVAAAGLHADEGGAFGARLPIDEGSAGCAGAGANGGAVVQYPRYGCRRIRIFLGRDGYAMSPPGVSAVAPRPAAIAPQTTAESKPTTPDFRPRRGPGISTAATRSRCFRSMGERRAANSVRSLSPLGALGRGLGLGISSSTTWVNRQDIG